MYSNSEATMLTPIIESILEKCYDISGQSTCNARNVGAILRLKNGDEYLGSNGNKSYPCNELGPDHCTRDKSVDMLEFLSCPSACAEGEAMLKAYCSGQDLKEGQIYTTGFPCRRCKDLIIHFKIKDVFFTNYKKGEPRLYEELYAAEMTCRGISVTEFLKKADGEPTIDDVIFDSDFEDFAKRAMITPGESWLRLFFDDSYRKFFVERTLELKKASEPIPEDFQGVIARMIL